MMFWIEWKMWGWVTNSSRMVWQEVITDLWSFYTWIGMKFQRTTIKILVCIVFRKDVCITNTDICELWMNFWIMKFKVFTAVLLKTNLQVCVLFNENWEGYLVANDTTWCTLFLSWFDILIHAGSTEMRICQCCLKEEFSLSVTWGHVGGVLFQIMNCISSNICFYVTKQFVGINCKFYFCCM